MNSSFRVVKMWKLVCLPINEIWFRLAFCFMTQSWESIFQKNNAVHLFFSLTPVVVFLLVSVTLLKKYIFIYLFLAALGLSLFVVSGGYSSLWCVCFSLRCLLLLQSTGSRHAGFRRCGERASVVVESGLSCSAACGIFPDQGSNTCPLHWQADS